MNRHNIIHHRRISKARNEVGVIWVRVLLCAFEACVKTASTDPTRNCAASRDSPKKHSPRDYPKKRTSQLAAASRLEQTKELLAPERIPIVERLYNTFATDISCCERPLLPVVAVLTSRRTAQTAIFSVLDAVASSASGRTSPLLCKVDATACPAIVADWKGAIARTRRRRVDQDRPYPVFESARTQNTTPLMFAFSANVYGFNVQFDGKPYSADSEPVSGNYFNGLDLQMVLGRPILPDDDLATAPPVAVVSYNFWKGKLGGDEWVVGKPIVINSLPLTVVGVAPQEFFGTQPGEDNDVWVTLHMTRGWFKPGFRRSAQSGAIRKPRGAYWRARTWCCVRPG